MYYELLPEAKIVFNYLKQYKYFQTNDYYYEEIVTWNHIIIYKLFVLDWNTSDHITVCELFVLDRNT